MNLRQRLVAYVLASHLVFLGATLWFWQHQPLVVVGVELLLLASGALGLHLVSRALQPLEHARRFRDLLQDRNYAARLQDQPDDELAGLVRLFNDMLHALYKERVEVGEQRGFLERLLEATPSAVVVFDFDGRVSLLNASALALLGLRDPVGHPLSDWQDGPGAFADGLDAAGRKRAAGLVAALMALPAGEGSLLVDDDGRRYRAQRGQFFDRGFARDFLLVEELTEALESSEKATYEKLVRVLAHEVNNTVAATGSVLESVAAHLSRQGSADDAGFGTAIEAVRRRNAGLGEFIERFTRVVKMPAAQPQPTAIGAMVDDIVQLYREPCRARGIEIRWERRDAVPMQALDRNLMDQALLNIVKNAMEAAESSSREHGDRGGHVRVELAVDPDRRVRLSVRDSGDRLGEVPAGQMFTPFFTTKKGGQGIGLLFVREVLNRHGLSYRLAPTGQGETRFDIWFPDQGAAINAPGQPQV